MVNKFLDAITIQLHSAFGDNYKYYIENVEQHLTKPCFTIEVLTLPERSRSRLLYDRAIPIVVHYFSNEKSTTKQDCYEKAEIIRETLEYVPFEGSMLRAEDMDGDIVDDVLQMFFTYRFITKKLTSNEDEMGELVESKIAHK